jgi:hypothetical protein
MSGFFLAIEFCGFTVYRDLQIIHPRFSKNGCDSDHVWPLVKDLLAYKD